MTLGDGAIITEANAGIIPRLNVFLSTMPSFWPYIFNTRKNMPHYIRKICGYVMIYSSTSYTATAR